MEKRNSEHGRDLEYGLSYDFPQLLICYMIAGIVLYIDCLYLSQSGAWQTIISDIDSCVESGAF